jgi:thiol-disulfide isomerase/thioredoxin
MAKKFATIIFVLILGCVGLAKDIVGTNAPSLTIREWVTQSHPDVANLTGQVYVIEFWATWCHSCVQNIPHLIEFNDKYKDKGLTFIALSQDRSIDELRKFVQDKKINYSVALDNGSADNYSITGYPTIVVVNHLGQIVWQGYPWDGGFEKAIKNALADAPKPILAGLDLGPFDNLRAPLSGGNEFAQAYYTVQSSQVSKEQTENAKFARQIISTIDNRIIQLIDEANRLRAQAPAKACAIYASIVAKYDGIEIVKPAKAAYLELKNTNK